MEILLLSIYTLVVVNIVSIVCIISTNF